jgi:uncharacterized protein
MAYRASSLVAILAAAALVAGCGGASSTQAGPNPSAYYKLKVGPATASVRMAADPETRAQGLSGKIQLKPDEGMLFIFPVASRPAFWMKDTQTPLSIAFITPDGEITEIMDMAPETLDLHAPKELATMALEMRQGWFAEKSVKPGDKVTPVGGSIPVALY